jgi:hypothetical protein
MLGWHISVYRQADDKRAAPATTESREGGRLAVWQTGLGGLDWIDELVNEGKAINLGGSGITLFYTAIADHLIPHIVDGPPGARNTWALGPTDIITEKWDGKTVIDRAAVADCCLDEWLLIVAWDES